MSDEDFDNEERSEEQSELRSPASRSMELPAVILGDRGEDDEQPPVRVLPGRVPKYVALYPAYAAALLAGMLAVHFSLRTGEWHPLMPLLGWGLLWCWYWVYGVAYRYRRTIMKYYSLLVGAVTAGSLIMISAVRALAMPVPGEGSLVVRGPQPLLFAVAVLTTLSLAAVITHVVYLGRGYRQKSLDGDNEAQST